MTEERASLEKEITLEEVQAAIAGMKTGKCPGPNGIPAEVYKKYSELLSPHLLNLFLGARDEGSLPLDLRKATIVAIHKPGKPRDECGSYRPISLLNVDTKFWPLYWLRDSWG